MSPHQKSRCPAGHRAVEMLGSKITDLMFYFILIRSLRQQGELSSVQYQLPTFKLNNSFNGQSKETKVVKLISSLFFDKVKLKIYRNIFFCIFHHYTLCLWTMAHLQCFLSLIVKDLLIKYKWKQTYKVTLLLWNDIHLSLDLHILM